MKTVAPGEPESFITLFEILRLRATNPSSEHHGATPRIAVRVSEQVGAHSILGEIISCEPFLKTAVSVDGDADRNVPGGLIVG